MNLSPTITLNNGVEMPKLGFGVFQIEPGDATVAAVTTALEAGYRHVDTATIYGNEAAVGRAVRESSVPREEIFVTSKVWNDMHGRDETLRAFDATMEAMGLAVLDLYLVHWPVTGLYVETWKTLVELQASGRVRAVGVSNFEPHHLAAAIDATGVAPAVNQVELHPYLQQHAIREACAKAGTVVEAWSPIAQGAIVPDETLTRIGQAHGKSSVQVGLRWLLQKGCSCLPRSVKPHRIRENRAVFDFELSEEEVSAIDALHRGEEGRTGPHPDTFV